MSVASTERAKALTAAQKRFEIVHQEMLRAYRTYQRAELRRKAALAALDAAYAETTRVR